MQPTNQQTTAMGLYAQKGYIPQTYNLKTEGPAQTQSSAHITLVHILIFKMQ